MVEMLRLVDKLHEENRVMAGRIGWLEAQIEQLKALPPASPESSLAGPPANATVETTQTSSTLRNGRAWWRFW
jgi:hypothetical protein